MPRPKVKTSVTTLKMSPEVRHLWEQCAVEEHRTLTNMFEVLVRDYAKRHGIKPTAQPATEPASSSADVTESKTD